MRIPVALLAALALLPVAASPAPAEPAPTAHTYAVEAYSIQVQGQTATGWLAYPTDGAPTTLLVYAHGCCGYNVAPGNVAGFAQAYGAVAVGMQYRGNGHWSVETGHLDTIAATEDLHARFPTVTRTIIWGVSMGGEVSGMAVAARPDLYDDWVDTFGVTDLFQEFLALGLYPGIGANPNDPADPVGSWILEETGGLPGVAPLDAWVHRSPDLRTDEMRGLKRAYIEHGAGDLIVYPTESLATFARLQASGVPATLCLAATGYGGVSGPFVGVFVPNVPYGLPAPIPRSLPVGVPGPAAHDGRGDACTGYHLDALLRGLEPDAGSPAAMYVVDGTTGQFAGTPLPPALP
ncbi:MAG: S9 family peptidase [Halobacteriales archaeon]|nr:S9 family peptidase [Halobacteriales archaeon]